MKKSPVLFSFLLLFFWGEIHAEAMKFKIQTPDDIKAEKIDISPDGKHFYYIYIKNGTNCLNIDGHDFYGFEYYPNIVFSDNGDYGFTYLKDGKDYFNINGKEYGGYNIDKKYNDEGEKISAGECTLQISKDGSIIAYAYQIDYLKYYNINGKVYGPYEGRSLLDLSVDGTKFAFSYWTNHKAYMNINGDIYGPYDNVFRMDFSETGHSFAFPFILNGKEYMSINGIVFGGYDSASTVKLSSDGSKYGFIYILNKKSYINICGKEYGGFESINAYEIFPGWKGFLFEYEKDNQCYININGKIYSGFYKSFYHEPELTKEWSYSSMPLNTSKDGTKYGLAYYHNGKIHVVVNEAKLGMFQDAMAPVFSDDGNSYGFVYKLDGYYEVMINRKVCGTGYDAVKYLSLSADGSHWGFMYKKSGTWFVNMDGMSYGGYKSEYYNDPFWKITYSPDGKKYGFLYYDNSHNFFVNINGQINGGYQMAMDPVFSADGNKYGFIYFKNGKYFMNINGKSKSFKCFGFKTSQYLGKPIYLLYQIKDYIYIEEMKSLLGL